MTDNKKPPPDDLDTLRADREFFKELLGLGSQEKLTPLLERALDLIVRATRARKGYIELSTDKPDEQWSIANSLTDDEVAKIRAHISHGIIQEALAQGRTIETASAISDPRFADRPSVISHQIQAVLCAPVGDPAIGVVYLQGREEPGPFGAEDKDRAELFAQTLAPLADRLVNIERRHKETDPTAGIRARFACPDIVGRSRRLADVLETAANLAPLDIDVLLTGPSGTGKTVLARTIAHNSPRARGPFIELNCAAIPVNLIESELFGALPGAYSGATRRMTGKVEAASGGTLFLDEVGELPLESQAKLLQLLQSRMFYPLGATQPIKADVRIISATNSHLSDMVAEKKFREDLYFRLNVIPIELPSLSDRPDDIPLLAKYFCREVCARHNFGELTIERQALVACQEETWPGNVRQLANAIEAAAIRARGQGHTSIGFEHLFPDVRRDESSETKHRNFQEAMRNFQRKFLLESLEKSDWNVTETARQLDIARSHLYNLINAHELKRARPNRKRAPTNKKISGDD